MKEKKRWHKQDREQDANYRQKTRNKLPPSQMTMPDPLERDTEWIKELLEGGGKHSQDEDRTGVGGVEPTNDRQADDGRSAVTQDVERSNSTEKMEKERPSKQTPEEEEKYQLLLQLPRRDTSVPSFGRKFRRRQHGRRRVGRPEASPSPQPTQGWSVGSHEENARLKEYNNFNCLEFLLSAFVTGLQFVINVIRAVLQFVVAVLVAPRFVYNAYLRIMHFATLPRRYKFGRRRVEIRFPWFKTHAVSDPAEIVPIPSPAALAVDNSRLPQIDLEEASRLSAVIREGVRIGAVSADQILSALTGEAGDGAGADGSNGFLGHYMTAVIDFANFKYLDCLNKLMGLCSQYSGVTPLLGTMAGCYMCLGCVRPVRMIYKELKVMARGGKCEEAHGHVFLLFIAMIFCCSCLN